jgi:hypothetical protein
MLRGCKLSASSKPPRTGPTMLAVRAAPIAQPAPVERIPAG